MALYYLKCGMLILAVVFTHNARADDLQERVAFWESKALLCPAEPGRSAFPAKQTGDPAQPCDDGDMTLFNGLLCAAGNKHGCTGVAEAQDPNTGEWFRSPRIRLHGNDRGGSNFSPDMALGVQLYLIKTGDVARAHKWLLWIHSHVACSIDLFGKCVLYAFPRFCTDDAEEKGCTMRPGDAAQLSATVNYMQANLGMPDLPDGRLRGYLGTFSGYGPAISEIDAMVNRPGYSQHLVAVSVHLMRSMGQNDTSIAKAARTIAEKEPRNAYFRYLDGGPTPAVQSLVLEKCPAPDRLPVPPLHQWQWEREETDKAWEHSIYWDCIFMADLIRQP